MNVDSLEADHRPTFSLSLSLSLCTLPRRLSLKDLSSQDRQTERQTGRLTDRQQAGDRDTGPDGVLEYGWEAL